MENLTHQLKDFSKQMHYALGNYKPLPINLSQIQTIVIGGLGGSGIAGRIVKNYFSDKLELPIEIVSDYIFPRFVNSKSLIILSSFSGNSEETLALYSQAKEKKAKVIILTAGGELKRKADEDGFPVFLAEPKYEARMGLGYSLTYLFQIFFDLLGQYKQADLNKIADHLMIWEDFMSRGKEWAQSFGNTIQNKFIVVCDPPMEGLATRFVQQIQENSKSEAFLSILPEGNHNTLSTYEGNLNSNFVFLNSRSSERTNLRFLFLKELLGKNYPIFEIPLTDNSMVSQFNTLYTMDWMAIELVNLKGGNMENSQNVVNLKQFLNKK